MTDIPQTERERFEKELKEKYPEKQNETKTTEPDTKTEGVANDIVSSIEPLMRAGEKLFDLDRKAVGTKLFTGLLTGKFGGVDGLFGGKQKKTRLEKFKEAFEIAIWVMLLLMLFLWINFGIARWMGLI